MTGHLGDALSALADAELADAELADAQVHLGACPACSAELVATARVRDLVRGLPHLDPRVSLDVRGVETIGRRWAASAAAVAAAVALVLLTAVGAGQAPTPAPVGRLVQAHATSAVNADPLSQLAPAAIPISFVNAP